MGAYSSGSLFVRQQVYLDLWETLKGTMIAFAIAVSAGVPLGIIIGFISPLRNVLRGPLDFARSIPAFVLLPLALALLKSGDVARVGIAVFGGRVVMTAHTVFGVAHMKPLRLEVARVYGGSF